MQAIADAAGVSRLTVYRRYPDRRSLMAGLRAAVENDAGALLDAFPGWGAGTDAFRLIVGSLVDLLIRYPIIIARPPMDGRPGDPSVDQDQRDPAEPQTGPTNEEPDRRPNPPPGRRPAQISIDQRIREVLAAGQRAGVLRIDIDTDTLNATMFGVLASNITRRKHVEPAVLANELTDLLLNGVANGQR